MARETWLDRTVVEDVDARRAEVRAYVLNTSEHLRDGDSTLSVPDMGAAFAAYDDLFFDGWLRRHVSRIDFALNGRLRRSAGRLLWKPSLPGDFTLELSPRLLRQSFADVEREVRVNGCVVNDQLDAALRVFEHELVHLTEVAEFGRSSCDRARFARRARNLFGHRSTKHEMVTVSERAAAVFDIRPGCQVRFRYRGRFFVGRVNRITQRATVLVPDARGERYSDGGTYAKFYVPVEALSRVD